MENPNQNSAVKFFQILILALTLYSLPIAAQTNLPCTSPPSGMVAWFTGDGNAVDIQGANNGTLQNGATFTTAANGKVREAFTFDGTDDFVEVADSATLRPAQVTLDAWVKPTSYNTYRTIVSKEPIESSSQVGYAFRQREGNKFWFVIGRPGFGVATAESTTVFTTGLWYHLTGTYDGSQAKLYVNGVLEATANGAASIDSTFPLRIGRLNGDSEAFQGQIDEVALFNRVLAPDEIQAIYNSGSNGKCKPISNQILLVGNLAQSSVRKYDADTLAYLGDLVAPGSGGLVDPFGLAFDGANTLYVSDYTNDRVRRYDIRTGAYLGDLDPANTGGLDKPIGITFGPDGKLYVAEQGPGRVLRYNFTTNAYEIFVSAPTGSPELYLSDVAFGPDSTGDAVPELYVTDLGFPQGNPGGVRRYNGATGAFIDYFVPLGAGGLQGAYYLQFRPDGFLYVSDFFNRSVKRYNAATGTFVDNFTGADDPQSRFLGLAFGANGNLFVSRTTPSNGGGGEIFEASGTNGSLISVTASMPQNPTDLLFIPALCSPAPAGQVAFYTADGTAEDSVGTNEGTMQNGAFYGAGKAGSAAFNFDGVDDFVSAPNSASLNFGSGAFSIETWVNFNATSNEQVLVEKFIETNDSNTTGYSLTKMPDNRIRLVFTTGAFVESAPQTLAANTWYHIAATRDAGGAVSIYLNGVSIASGTNTNDVSSTSSLKIGHRGNPADTSGSNDTRGFYLNGRVDEVSLYNTALTAADIANIFKTGKGGKCRPTNQCTLPPAQMTSWYRGEGNAIDTIGTNNGASNGTYAAGKVGQAFSFDGSSQFAEIPDSPTFNTKSLTLDAWINPDTLTGPSGYRSIITKYDTFQNTTGASFYLLMLDGGKLNFGVIQNNTTYRVVTSNSPVLTAGAWQHVAGVFDFQSQELRIYVNGVEVPSTLEATTAALSIADSASSVRLGALRVADGSIQAFWDGLIDEAEIINRALSQNEIQALYNAGTAGKCLTPELSLSVTNTPAYQNADFTFTATVTNDGAATATGVVLNATLPAELSFVSADAGCIYDASTRRVSCTIGTIGANFAEQFGSAGKTTQYGPQSPEASVVRNIVVQPTAAGPLAIVFTATANEADAVIANNLFAANINVLAPTAASVSVGGRVTTADGRGVANALITLTDASGATRRALTGSFGYYDFTDVDAGQTVILQIFAKRFSFVPQTRVVNVTEEIDDADFTAEP